ncbi:unnamed protein product [Protopolystoma xenopodis]|uniref:Uncharacterized protein n=1 Tax=Protopolystoma xenopodis TaxID=117903 RepID=A0A448WLD3_9PLAT|nr:unnamed protein product [Protopolystoma xenopodis]
MLEKPQIHYLRVSYLRIFFEKVHSIYHAIWLQICFAGICFRFLVARESQLCELALGSMESSPTIAQCLSFLTDFRTPPSIMNSVCNGESTNLSANPADSRVCYTHFYQDRLRSSLLSIRISEFTDTGASLISPAKERLLNRN